MNEHNAVRIAPQDKTTIWQQIKDAKEIIAIGASFAIAIYALINFVATKHDIKKLSCMLDIQFKVTQATIQKGEEEKALKGINKEANGLPSQRTKGFLTETEFTDRMSQINSEQKEIEERIKGFQKQIDEGAPISVSKSCDK